MHSYKQLDTTTSSAKTLGNDSTRFNGTLPSIIRWKEIFVCMPNCDPRANPTERGNQDIKINIRLRNDNGNHGTWNRDLPKILFSLRWRQNTATGRTPSHSLLGWTLPRPSDWRFHERDEPRIEERHDREERVKINEEKYQQRYTDETPVPRFQCGEQVYVDDSSETEEVPDRVQPQESSNHCYEEPLRSTAGTILRMDRPPPPSNSRHQRPTNYMTSSAQPGTSVCLTTRIQGHIHLGKGKIKLRFRKIRCVTSGNKIRVYINFSYVCFIQIKINIP